MRTLDQLGCWALAMVLFGASGHARACPALCETLRTFGIGAIVPGNQVYFKVFADDPGPLSLKAADGREIPASIRMIGPDRVYAPIDPIPAGTVVVLTYAENTCGQHLDPLNYVFQTSASADIRLQDALISNGEYGIVGGLTGHFEPAVTSLAFQRVNYGSPDAAGAVTHLIYLDVNVDGGPFFYPSPNNYGFPIEVRAACSATDPLPRQVGTTCGEPIYGPGHHTITMQPHIVGYADPPPSSLDIDFDMACGVNGATPAAAAADAGARTSSPPAPADSGVTMQPTDAGMSNASSAGSVAVAQGDAAIRSQSLPQASGGCSATHQRAGEGAVSWLVMLTLSCLARRWVRS